MKTWKEMTQREKDVHVAEKVMGLKEAEDEFVPFYTSDIASAWLVIQKMVERMEKEPDFFFRTPNYKKTGDVLYKRGATESFWHCTVHVNDEVRTFISDNPYEVICKAAVYACGGNVEVEY